MTPDTKAQPWAQAPHDITYGGLLVQVKTIAETSVLSANPNATLRTHAPLVGGLQVRTRIKAGKIITNYSETLVRV